MYRYVCVVCMPKRLFQNKLVRITHIQKTLIISFDLIEDGRKKKGNHTRVEEAFTFVYRYGIPIYLR